jgi:hypothetical protein
MIMWLLLFLVRRGGILMNIHMSTNTAISMNMSMSIGMNTSML